MDGGQHASEDNGPGLPPIEIECEECVAIIVGIDEAGLGPVLGPLVVSAAAISLPEELADSSMWELLAGAVTRKAGRRHDGAIAIDDSKKLYSSRKAGGVAALERGVLAMLSAGGVGARSFRQLLEAVAPQAVKPLERYPWYSGRDQSLPMAAGATDIALASNAVRAAMSARGMSLVGMRSEVILAGQFNRLIEATRNKATATFGVTCRLVARAFRQTARHRVLVCVDQQGGRRHYLPALQRAFDGASFKVLEETDTLSCYVVGHNGREARILFSVGAEKHHLPVALASMLSKYLRELFMKVFNAFWAGYIPELRPTAGYYTDGRRFYQEIQPAIQRLGVDRDLIYRSR